MEKIIKTQGESRPIDYEWVVDFLCRVCSSTSFRLLSAEIPRTYPRLSWISSSKVRECMVLFQRFFFLILLRYFCFLLRIFSKPISSFFFSESSDFKSPLILMCRGLTCAVDWLILSLDSTVYINYRELLYSKLEKWI